MGKLNSKAWLSTRAVTYTAVLVALSVVTNAYSVNTPLIAISFNYVVYFTAGYFLGPLLGGIVGCMGDLLGCFIQGYAPNPVITLGSILYCVIPGLIRLIPLKKLAKSEIRLYARLAISFAICFVFLTCFLNTFGLWWFFSSKSKTFWVYLLARLPSQSAVMVINVVITAIVATALDKYVFKQNWLSATKKILSKHPVQEPVIVPAEISEADNAAIKNEDVSKQTQPPVGV